MIIRTLPRLLKWAGIAVTIGILFVLILPIILILAAVIGVSILGEGQVKKYYSKFDVAAEASL